MSQQMAQLTAWASHHKATLPTVKRAEQIIGDLDRRAFEGRLKQHGIIPTNAKEAQALHELGAAMAVELMDPAAAAAAADQPQADLGAGPFARAKAAYFKMRGLNDDVAPGFEKASEFSPYEPELPESLVKAAHTVAMNQASLPEVYGAVLVATAQICDNLAEAAAGTA